MQFAACLAGNATIKAVQAFVWGGFPAAAIAQLTTDDMPAFMSADGGKAPRVGACSIISQADVCRT